MQKLKPSCWPEVRVRFLRRRLSPELHAAAQAVAIFLGPCLPALQRLRLQAREPGAWNGLTPQHMLPCFLLCIHAAGPPLPGESLWPSAGLPLSSLYSASFLCPYASFALSYQERCSSREMCFYSPDPSGCCFPVFVPSSGITILKDDSEAQELR